MKVHPQNVIPGIVLARVLGERGLEIAIDPITENSGYKNWEEISQSHVLIDFSTLADRRIFYAILRTDELGMLANAFPH